MILEIENLTKLYKNGRGAEDITFSLAPGEVLGLLGPNGSGKTTTMKVIAGLLRPTRGTVRVCGFDALEQHERAMRETGCLIESPALYDHLTATQNMKLAARFYPEVNGARIEEVLTLVGMEKYRKDKVGSFSLGMRQRIGIALALLSRPKLLILDEPANGLDIEGMIFIREVVKASAQLGSAVLISSHLAHEIEQCATNVAVLYGGKLLSMDTLAHILEESPSLEDYFLSLVSKTREGISL